MPRYHSNIEEKTKQAAVNAVRDFHKERQVPTPTRTFMRSLSTVCSHTLQYDYTYRGYMEAIRIEWLGDKDDGVETRRMQVQEMDLNKEDTKKRKKAVALAAARYLETKLEELSRFDKTIRDKGNLEKYELHDILKKAGNVDKKINVLIRAHTRASVPKCKHSLTHAFAQVTIKGSGDLNVPAEKKNTDLKKFIMDGLLPVLKDAEDDNETSHEPDLT